MVSFPVLSPDDDETPNLGQGPPPHGPRLRHSGSYSGLEGGISLSHLCMFFLFPPYF